MLNDLLRYKDQQKYVLFDLETCHLNLMVENYPWQIGYLVCEGKKIIKTNVKFIKWENLKLSKPAEIITKFNREQYEAAMVDPKVVLNEFEHYLYDREYIVLGHNILNFDVYVHNQWRKALGKKTDYSYIERCIDTSIVAKAIKKGLTPQKKDSLIEFQYRVGNIIEKGLKTSLTTLGKEYQINFNEHNLHDAANDVQLNWKIWNRQIYEFAI